MESKDELWRILQNEELGSIPVLVVANKQDLPNAMSTTEVEEKLEVQGMKDRITCKCVYNNGLTQHIESFTYV